MNRAQAMEQLGDRLGVGPVPDTITGLVAALGGTRATAGLLGAPIKPANKEEKTQLASAQRTLQRYMKAEAGERGKNVRGATTAAHDKLTANLRGKFAEREKDAATARRPRGFHATVKGNFFMSYPNKGRAVKPVYIPRADMEAIIEHIQAGDYNTAADAFNETYGISYDVEGMQWGEDENDPDAFDSLDID